MHLAIPATPVIPKAATVRVFLCTYRRHKLLHRALQSLLAQSFTDWVCELHNDAPGDPYPAELCAEAGDARITVVNHPENLGGIGTFNLMFDPRPERYISLLEDDNWWEPDFLARMVTAMDSNPRAIAGWANMRIWSEGQEGAWIDTQQLVWNCPSDAPVELFTWPHYQQAWHSLHSTGSMLVRAGDLIDFKLPLKMRFDFADPVRERAMPHPLLFMPAPLVNFSLTRETARTSSRIGLAEHYVLLLLSFFQHVHPSRETVQAIWKSARACDVRSTDKLLLAGIYDSACRPLLREATAMEWLLFLAAQLRRPRSFLHAMRARTRYPELWAYLDHHTRIRASSQHSTA
jgi:hypothetical protein